MRIISILGWTALTYFGAAILLGFFTGLLLPAFARARNASLPKPDVDEYIGLYLVALFGLSAIAAMITLTLGLLGVLPGTRRVRNDHLVPSPLAPSQPPRG